MRPSSDTGHDGKVCAVFKTKVSAARTDHAPTLLGAKEQSMRADSRINGLAVASVGDQPRSDKQSVYVSRGAPLWG